MTRALVAARRLTALALLGLAATWTAPGSAGAATLRPSAPSAGCRQARAAKGVEPRPGDRANRVTVGGVPHGYLLSVPARSDPRRPMPLVLLFHGFGGDASSMADLTNMPLSGASRGVIVVTPDGPNRTWQLNGTGTDAAFIDGLVSTLSSTLCVDLHRVYTAGYSQGAAFAIFYSCARPDRIAAIATVAVEFQLGCTRPVPILAFHGTADPAVPYQDGGTGLSLPGAKVRGTMLNMSDWARLDQCGPTPKTTTVGTEVTLAAWPNCGRHTDVKLYTITGGGHTWPGADPAKNPTHTTNQIDATKLMLDFFARHPLR